MTYKISRKRIDERDDIIDTFLEQRDQGFSIKDAAMAAANIHDRSYTFVLEFLKSRDIISGEE